MSGQTTRTNDYAIRLERVFRWLADHLDDAVDLATLAEVACLSPYHFHRVYRSMRGETVTDTVRRLRLHRAAVELIRPRFGSRRQSEWRRSRIEAST